MSKIFSVPRRAVTLDELSGSRKSVAFSRVVTGTDRQIEVERTESYGMGRFQRVVHG
ncbi:MAG TPA: hypothetical protein VGJ91_13955 [Polyangiaceae bacterium]